MNEQLIAFLSGEGTDDRGRVISDIATWSNFQLESCHDYIQWVFPNRTRSRFNPGAPPLDKETIVQITECPAALDNVRRMFSRMVRFYGLKIRSFKDGSFQIELAHPERKPMWITPGNHNYLRLTRILLTLKDLGLHDEFFALADILDLLSRRFHPIIGEDTKRHWQDIGAALD